MNEWRFAKSRKCDIRKEKMSWRLKENAETFFYNAKTFYFKRAGVFFLLVQVSQICFLWV